MKFSSKIEACELSPIRKFHPYVLAAEAKGRTVHHLNIGLFRRSAQLRGRCSGLCAVPRR